MATNKAVSKAPVKTVKKAPAKTAAKAPAKVAKAAPSTPAKKAPVKTPVKTAVKAAVKVPAKPVKKSTAKVAVKAPVKPAAKEPAKAAAKAPAKAATKAPAKAPVKAAAKAPAKTAVSADKKATSKPAAKTTVTTKTTTTTTTTTIPVTENLPAPTPMAGANQPVDWMLAFKFNSNIWPGCDDNGTVPAAGSPGLFGGTVRTYKEHSQNYIYASSANPTLVKGTGCLGATLTDPLGATFNQVYNTPGYYYVAWNDQFYNNPIKNEDSPMGHAKGMVAWNDNGEGFVLQVSTPSWPGSLSKEHPRAVDGNTLGCMNDDDIEVSQHFFALKINHADLCIILKALGNASVATNKAQPSIFNNGGPADVQALANALGSESNSTTCTVDTLSSGVQIISKPSKMQVPPWQMVSAKLDSVPLRVASWWAAPFIGSTKAGEIPGCWAPGLGTPGAVEIAKSGTWNGQSIGLTGGDGEDFNHAKIGISTDPSKPLCILGDMNQQGALCTNYAYQGQQCDSSQNGRGGTFYVLNNSGLCSALTDLLKGNSSDPDVNPNK